MKRLLPFLACWPLWATVTINYVCPGAGCPAGIQIGPAQLLIDVTAPDGTNPIKVECSESATYSPLIHDVDSALFTGSNLDTRPGAFGASRGGTHRVFICGTKTVQTANDGVKYSRAAQQSTLHPPDVPLRCCLA